jgi:hypothetical protein
LHDDRQATEAKLSPANCRVIVEELLLIRRWMMSIWLIADKGGTWWTCFESSKGPQCFQVLSFFLLQNISSHFVSRKKKNKQIKLKQKSLKLMDSVSPLKVLPDQKM